MSIDDDLLLGEDDKAFEAALVTAVRSGAAGERRLLDALPFAPDGDRAVGIVAALGEADGPAGVAVLRAIVAEPVDPLEVRTTALLSLTKRQGVEAPDVLLGCLDDADPQMPGYALLGLASTGDDRAWHDVLAWLRDELRQRPADPEHDFDERAPATQSALVAAVCYLARHAARSWDRQQPVLRLLRWRWNHLGGTEQRWLAACWPACDPARPDEYDGLDATWFADWISYPMFSASFG